MCGIYSRVMANLRAKISTCGMNIYDFFWIALSFACLCICLYPHVMCLLLYHFWQPTLFLTFRGASISYQVEDSAVFTLSKHAYHKTNVNLRYVNYKTTVSSTPIASCAHFCKSFVYLFLSLNFKGYRENEGIEVGCSLLSIRVKYTITNQLPIKVNKRFTLLSCPRSPLKPCDMMFMFLLMSQWFMQEMFLKVGLADNSSQTY